METSSAAPAGNKVQRQPWRPWPWGPRRAIFGGLVWVVFFLVISAVGWASLLRHLDDRERETTQRALAEVSRSANGYASYLRQNLSSIDQLTLSIRYGWEKSEGNLNLEEMLIRGIFRAVKDFYVGIFDENGRLLSNTVPGSRSVNTHAAPFFLYHKNSPSDDRLYIDAPSVGTFTKREVIRVSRKLLHPDGRFAGIVVVSVTPAYLTANYDSMLLGKRDFIGVYGQDNTLRAARFGSVVQSVTSSAILKPPSLSAHTGTAVWQGTERFADGRTRYVGWTSIPDFPLLALVGLDKEDFFAAYTRYRTQSIRSAALVNIFFGLLCLAGALLSLRLSWRKHLHERLQETYRLATEIATEGFFILRPIYASNGERVDLEFVDCNERGAQFMGTTREGIIGHRVSESYEGQLPQQIVEILALAVERGEYEQEIMVGENSPFRANWLHYKVVLSDGLLAVTLRDISDAKAHMQELERRSNEDALTGLPNRRWLNEYLPRAVAAASSRNDMLAVLFIDLDGFKRVNDMMGHAIGDELLHNAGRRLKLAVRPSDDVVRMGGDEFVVVVENIHSAEEAAHVAERILHAFEEGFRLSKGMHHVGTSVGISVFPRDGASAVELIKHADVAMYSVKSAGKRHYRFYDEGFDAEVNARHRQELELRHALDSGQFVMYYQPRIDLVSGRTSSMEALVRWAHPTRGIVEPNEFIALAEETGLIVELGRQAIDKVCAQIALWKQQARPLVPVSINVSARQFDEANLGELLSTTIKRYGLEPSLVEIELTESTMSRNIAAVGTALDSLQHIGIKLLVDDFGTGYSSLSQLQRFDFDVLKVDRSFTAELNKSAEGMALFRAIITMAHELNMRVVAEGVETVEQLKTLASLHCDEIQGFLVSRPLPPPQTQEELLCQFSVAV